MEQQEIYITSSVDNTAQPSLFYKAKGKKRPLLVGLHTWSHDRFNQIGNMLPYAEKHDFNLLLPEFRGSNLPSNPNCQQACGSLCAKQDVKDAIDYVVAEESVDAENIFLLGLSGGGHMALLMAGFCPELFKAVGAYVPITDLKKWKTENQNYAPYVEACCGNSDEELEKRSPIAYIATIAQANLKIFHGKFDPVVPVSQSLTLYRAIMEKHPQARVFLDVFDGKHEIDMEAAMYWLLSQYKPVEKVAVTG
ncbi:MAG: prolyl oligopeptidase family serine peptidase [Clostridia bacterium]|nr:prolyl oligopeptidase family serine peptidase [Clostridia bacterium]